MRAKHNTDSEMQGDYGIRRGEGEKRRQVHFTLRDHLLISSAPWQKRAYAAAMHSMLIAI